MQYLPKHVFAYGDVVKTLHKFAQYVHATNYMMKWSLWHITCQIGLSALS